MSIKAKEPKPDPETVARQKAAEQRAEAGRIEAAQEDVSEETLALIRTFGRLKSITGSLAPSSGSGLPIPGVSGLRPRGIPFGGSRH